MSTARSRTLTHHRSGAIGAGYTATQLTVKPRGSIPALILTLTSTRILTLAQGDNLWEYFFQQPGVRGLRLADLSARDGSAGGGGGGSGAVVRSVQARCRPSWPYPGSTVHT